jgi:hypothetical protein
MKTQKLNKAEFIDQVSAKLLDGAPTTKAELTMYAKLINEVSAKSAKPAKPAKSAKPAKPAKSAKPAKGAKPAKSAKGAKPAKPVNINDQIYFDNLASNGFDVGEIHVVNYISTNGKKCTGVFGDSKPIKELLFAIGAKFNRFLTYNNIRQAGFILSDKVIDKSSLVTKLQQYASDQISYLHVE